MSSKRSRWEIYKKQMSQLNHGDALWEPAPLHYFERIRPGDVGYIRRGCFNLLFSAGYPLGERELGVDVPRTFKQLIVGPILNTEPRSPGCLSAGAVREIPTRARASMYPLLEPGSGISLKLTGDQGAALLTKHSTYSEDVQRGGKFEAYAKTHYDSWVAFARECGHPTDIRPVLVTGVDLTRDFAMVSYSNDGDDLMAEFTISAPGVTSPWGTWRKPGAVYTNCGPQQRRPPSIIQIVDLEPSGNGHAETGSDVYRQCVFVRYYTVRKRLGIPRVIKAAAGPHDLGPGNRDNKGSPLGAQCSSGSSSDAVSSPFDDDGGDGGSSVTSIASESDIAIHNTTADERDDFDTVADYVFQSSNADSVLIHHQDIALLREPGGSTNLYTQLFEKQPPITVDRDGVAMIWRQTEPSTNAWPNDPHWIAPPTPSFIHSGSEREATNRVALPEPHPTVHQGYHPLWNAPNYTFDALETGALPPSLFPQSDIANAHFYGFPVQPSIPGSPSVTTTSSMANGPKSPIFNIFPDASRSPPATTVSLQVAFPSLKSPYSPSFTHKPDHPGDLAAMANQDPFATPNWALFPRTKATQPHARLNENTTRIPMGLVKKSRGRRVADVPNPLAEPPLPDTVFLGQESSSVPPWDLGETERDRRSDSGDAAKMSVTSFDYGNIEPVHMDCLPASRSWSQSPPSNVRRGWSRSSSFFPDPQTLGPADPEQSTLPTIGSLRAIRNSTTPDTFLPSYKRARPISPHRAMSGDHVAHPHLLPALQLHGFSRLPRGPPPPFVRYGQQSDFDFAVTKSGILADVRDMYQVNGGPRSPGRTAGTKRAADGPHIETMLRGDTIYGMSDLGVVTGPSTHNHDAEATLPSSSSEFSLHPFAFHSDFDGNQATGTTNVASTSFSPSLSSTPLHGREEPMSSYQIHSNAPVQTIFGGSSAATVVASATVAERYAQLGFANGMDDYSFGFYSPPDQAPTTSTSLRGHPSSPGLYDFMQTPYTHADLTQIPPPSGDIDYTEFGGIGSQRGYPYMIPSGVGGGRATKNTRYPTRKIVTNKRVAQEVQRRKSISSDNGPVPGTSNLSGGTTDQSMGPREGPDEETDASVTVCHNCQTTNTPLWRRDPEGRSLCNACGLFYKLHGVVRPQSLKTDVIKERDSTSSRTVGMSLPPGTRVEDDNVTVVDNTAIKRRKTSANVIRKEDKS